MFNLEFKQMRKIFLVLIILSSTLTSFGQFLKKNSAKLSGEEITFVTWANIDADTLMEAISVVKKGNFSSSYATKFATTPADTTLLADSIATTNPPVLLDWNRDNQIDIAFIISGTQDILLLINQGSLKFSKVRLSIGSTPLSKIQLTNFTNDGTRQAVATKISSGWSIFNENEGSYGLAIDSSYVVTDFYTFDFDGNGYTDIALSGTDALGKPYLKILQFEDSLQILRFVKISNPVNGKIESADLNYDGRFDLIVNGQNSQGKLVTQVFINNDSVFVTGNSYPALKDQTSTLADFDSDGKIDFASIGKDNGGNLFHWLKTFSGDSISFPTSHITHRAFGDFDRDGDLDLLMSTDTLGIVLYENPATKNLSPSKPGNEISAIIYNRLFLYWDISSDDHTTAPSLTYDIILNNSGNEIINGEFASNGLRLTTTNGNLGTSNFLLMKASNGIYNYLLEAVDNSFYTKKIAAGICNNSCTIQQPKTITTCNGKPTHITAQQPVLWFSFTRGYLGTSTSIKVPAKTDTIFSLLPHSSPACDAITIYLLKDLKQDTLKIAQNFFGCENSSLTFTMSAEWKNVLWKDTKGNSKGSGNSLDYKIIKDEIIIGTGSNSNGCFIKQTENIELSKPNLVLDGTDYRILAGSSATLSASGADTYLWQPAVGLNDASSSHPIASPDKTTTYTVTGLDSLNCSVQGKVMVEVFSAAFIPNLFSPNGDGKNDELRIYGLTDARDFHFSVYNREGSIIYESTDWMSVNWDGTKNGTQQPSGLYYWKIEGSFTNGQPLKLNEKTKGSVLLVR